MLIPILSCIKSVVDNSLDSQPKAVLERRTLPYCTTTTTKIERDREPIEIVSKDTKPEEGKSTMPRICGWNHFVKIKRVRTSKQLTPLDMVARDKNNHISVVHSSRFAHCTVRIECKSRCSKTQNKNATSFTVPKATSQYNQSIH